MAFDEIDEVPLCVAAERRFREMRIGGQKPLGHRFEIGEVAAPAPRNPDLFARRLGVVDNERGRPRMGRAHQARSACAKDQSVDAPRAHFAARG